MNALAFDTLAYARRLEGSGFSRQQAETLADEQAKLIDERLATKTDLRESELRLEAKIEAMRLATKADIRESELRLEAKIEAMRLGTKADIETARFDIVKWTVGMLAAQAGLIVAAIKLLH